MASAASGALAINRVLDQVMRDDKGRLLAALMARLGDMQRAEDALQDAMASALTHWGRNGVPASAQGWLLQVAWRKALDRIRRGGTESRGQADLLIRSTEVADEDADIPDHRLRLILTCCHPALDSKSRVALTLRTIAGLTTGEIARVFLDQEPTMGQRLSRAKARIAATGIAFQVPDAADWDQRLQSVLAVIYLIFTAGYTSGTNLTGRDLCEEAIFLATLVNHLRPADPEIEGALALLWLTHARRGARVDGQGATVPPSSQNRALWDGAMIARGRQMLDQALARRTPGPFQIKAAISALHSADTLPVDWLQIAALYHRLLDWEPTDVVRLNLAVAMAEAGQVDQGLTLLESLQPALADFQPWYAARAALLARKGHRIDAMAAFDQAIARADNPADIAFLQGRRRDLSG